MNKIKTRLKNFTDRVVCGERVPVAYSNSTCMMYKGRRIDVKGYFKPREEVIHDTENDYWHWD